MSRPLDRLDHIRECRSNLLVMIDEVQKRYRLEVVDLNRQIDQLSAICPHDWEYFSDPSGNNDSGYVCSACGKETRHIPK